MGSMISLGIGKFEIDWGKNQIVSNHSVLFQPEDIRPMPYYYADDVVESKDAFAKPLRQVVRRLELLGYTLPECRRSYEEGILRRAPWYSEPIPPYEKFAEALKRIDVNAISIPEEGDYDLGELAQRMLADPEFKRTLGEIQVSKDDAGEFFQNLDAYVILRLLAENERNLDELVAWRFADVVQGGWTPDPLYQGIDESQKYLLVTEGSSDGTILKNSLSIVAPELADFFRFIDMTENYPFTGTGNVYRFCQGLARIRVLNRILVVLDNDVAGRLAYKSIRSLDLPPNMRVTVLPELKECKSVLTMGPSGSQEEDINGRAVSSECFLDIWRGKDRPVVRWTTYNDDLQEYQGHLMQKEKYVENFLTAIKRRDASYDFCGLRLLWDNLIKACIIEAGC